MRALNNRVSLLFLALSLSTAGVSFGQNPTPQNQTRGDEQTIKGLVDQLSSSDFRVRQKALRTLSIKHGEYAAAYLTRFLGSNADPEIRITAMNALTSLGSDAVAPVNACTDSNDSLMRRGAVTVLAKILDVRAVPAIQKIIETDPEAVNREIAKKAITGMMGRFAGDSAHDLYCQLGEAYARKDPKVITEATNDVVWKCDDNLGAVKVSIPSDLFTAELSRECFVNALKLNPTSKRASAGLINAFTALASSTEPIGTTAQLGLAAAGVSSHKNENVAAATNNNNEDPAKAAEASAKTLNPEALNAAFEQGDKPAKYEAAISLAKGNAAGQNASKVATALASAVGENTAKIIQIIDTDTQRASRLATQLRAAGYFVSVSDTAISGYINVKRYGAADLILISPTLSDISTDLMLKEIQEDSRTATIPVFVLGEKKTLEKTKEAFGSRVKQVVDANAALDLAMVSEAVNAHENPNRVQAEKLAHDAAEALTVMDPKSADLTVASRSLLNAIQTKNEETGILAARALANAGTRVELEPMTRLFTDKTRSAAMRAALAEGIGGIFSRVEVAPWNTVKALTDAIQNDADANVRLAAATAIGKADLHPEDRVMVFTKVITLSTPNQAAAAKPEEKTEEKKVE